MSILIAVHLFYGNAILLSKKDIISVKKDFCEEVINLNDGYGNRNNFKECTRIDDKNGNIYFVKDPIKDLQKEIK